MTTNEILYRTLKSVRDKKMFPPVLSTKYIQAIIELNLVEDNWDATITKEGLVILNLLKPLFE